MRIHVCISVWVCVLMDVCVLLCVHVCVLVRKQLSICQNQKIQTKKFGSTLCTRYNNHITTGHQSKRQTHTIKTAEESRGGLHDPSLGEDPLPLDRQGSTASNSTHISAQAFSHKYTTHRHKHINTRTQKNTHRKHALTHTNLHSHIQTCTNTKPCKSPTNTQTHKDQTHKYELT